MIAEERSDKHKRNEQVEACLKSLEMLLGPVAREKQAEFTSAAHPVVFIMGCARSGTTILHQVLAQQLNCCYPSNFISRFFYAPYIGALLQKLMYDLDFKGELLNDSSEPGLSSLLGKTKGALGPNEFWYYWRRYFSFGATQKLDENNVSEAAVREFANGLYSIQGVFEKPLVLKGMILNWNIPFLQKSVEKSFFVFIERDLLYNAQSLYLARKEFYEDEKKWYSFFPEEYPLLRDKEPEEQVVAQAFYTNRAIRRGLEQLLPEQYLHISYHDFCSNPDAVIDALCSKTGCERKQPSFSGKLLEGNEIRVEKTVWEKLQFYAGKYASGEYGK